MKKSIVAWCKQAREFQDRRRVSNEITPRDLRGTIEKRTSGAKALINRLCCTTRLMPFVQGIFPHPQPASRSRRQNPKNILLSASGNVRNLDLRHVTILYTDPTAAPSGNTRVCRPEGLPHACADPAPTPPRATHRLPRAPGRRPSALSAHIFPKPFSTRRRPYPPAHTRRTGQPVARRASRGARPISSGSCSRHLTNC